MSLPGPRLRSRPLCAGVAPPPLSSAAAMWGNKSLAPELQQAGIHWAAGRALGGGRTGRSQLFLRKTGMSEPNTQTSVLHSREKGALFQAESSCLCEATKATCQRPRAETLAALSGADKPSARYFLPNSCPPSGQPWPPDNPEVSLITLHHFPRSSVLRGLQCPEPGVP